MHRTSFWCLVLLFIGGFFRLKSFICKKYKSTNGKDSKYANTIDISIIWSCGGVGYAGSLIAWIVSRAGSFFACIGTMAGSLITCIGSFSAFFCII